MVSKASLSDMTAVKLVMLAQCTEDAHISSALLPGMKLGFPVMVWSKLVFHQGSYGLPGNSQRYIL